jgi:hypothetical protein
MEAARQATARAMDSFDAQRRRLVEEFAAISPRLSSDDAELAREERGNR